MSVQSVVSFPSTESKADLGEATKYRQHLSDFQVEKFTYLFKALFDMDKNDIIDKKDIDCLTQKMKTYAKWTDDNEEYRNIVDVLNMFLECLQDQVKAERAATDKEDVVIESWEKAVKMQEPKVTSINLNQWLNMWGKLCYGSAGLRDFPIWVQFLPVVFFKVIDTDKDGILSKAEFERFYKDFVGVTDKQLMLSSNEGYVAMTAGGDYILSQDNYNFCFANFLLGRSIYGPGKHIFGVFDLKDLVQPYQVDYGEE